MLHEESCPPCTKNGAQTMHHSLWRELDSSLPCWPISCAVAFLALMPPLRGLYERLFPENFLRHFCCDLLIEREKWNSGHFFFPFWLITYHFTTPSSSLCPWVHKKAGVFCSELLQSGDHAPTPICFNIFDPHPVLLDGKKWNAGEVSTFSI